MKRFLLVSQQSPPRPDRAACLALHPDGDQLFSTGTSEGIKISRLARRREIGVLRTRAIIDEMVVEPSGERLLTLGPAGLTCWDLATRHPAYEVDDPSLLPGTIRFTAAGQGRILGCDGVKLTLLDLSTGAVLRRFEGGSRSLRRVVLSPDARHVLTLDAEGTLRRFDLGLGSCLGDWPATTYGNSSTPLRDVVLHPDGRRVLSTTLVETTLWDAEAQRLLWSIAGPTPGIKTAIFQPDGPFMLLEGHNGEYEIRDLEQGRVAVPGAILGRCGFGAFCRDPWHVVVAGRDGRGWRRLNLEHGAVQTAREGHPITVRRFLPHPTGHFLLTLDDDDEITIWNLRSASLLGTIAPRPGRGAPRGGLVTMSARYGSALSADRLGWVRHWDVVKGTCKRLARFDEPMVSLEFDAEGHHAILELEDRTVVWHLWGGERAEVTSPEKRERALAQSRDRVAAEIAMASALKAFAATAAETLDRIATHPDGDRVIGAVGDRVYLWSVGRRELLHSLHLIEEPVIQIAFDPPGGHALLVTAHTVRLWELATGAVVDQWTPDDGSLNEVIASASIGATGIIAVASAGQIHFLRADAKPLEAAPLETGVREGNPASPPRNGKRLKPWIEDLAAGWVRSGKRPDQLLGLVDTAITACWRITVGGTKEGLSEDAAELVARSFKAHEPSYHGWLATRDSCSGCRESYLVENLSFCTHCARLTCPRCWGDRPLHENGNRRCGCAGEGEIVG